jgi:hypothetical protein
MVASWVSQASFEPLGLTISVAKDRAIESMMQVRESPFQVMFWLSLSSSVTWVFQISYLWVVCQA